MLIVPRVATIGGIFSFAINRPLPKPIKVLTETATRIVRKILELQFIRKFPVITVVAAIIEATDTSIPPVSITRSIPKAIIVRTRLLLSMSIKFSNVRNDGLAMDIIAEISIKISKIGNSLNFLLPFISSPLKSLAHNIFLA
jgi:hypothetical protein